MFGALNGGCLEKGFRSAKDMGSQVIVKEIRSESSGSESARPIVGPESAIVPEPRRSARLRSVRDVMLLDSDEPATYQDAMGSPDSESRIGAMRSELKSLEDNQVWNLVELPVDARAVECKWVFKRKTDMDGNVSIYKARLVAKGLR